MFRRLIGNDAKRAVVEAAKFLAEKNEIKASMLLLSKLIEENPADKGIRGLYGKIASDIPTELDGAKEANDESQKLSL